MSRTDAINKVLGSLHRLRRTVIEPILIVCNVMELSVVYHHMGYSAGVQASALRRMASCFQEEPIWNHLPEIIENLRS